MDILPVTLQENPTDVPPTATLEDCGNTPPIAIQESSANTSPATAQDLANMPLIAPRKQFPPEMTAYEIDW